jgi:hypothetical protein
LLKKDWRISKPNKKEEFIYSPDFRGKKFFYTRDNGNSYKQLNLLMEKQKLFYRHLNLFICTIKQNVESDR